jgi:UDP-glucose 4-epimerase
MRVLITGAAGFVGASVLRGAIAAGHDVSAVLTSSTDRWRIADLEGAYRAVIGELGSSPSLAEQLRALSPEVVCHLAWSRPSAPPASHLASMNATIALFQTALESASCKAFIAAGSHEEYGKWNEPIGEHYHCQPSTVAGAARHAAATILRALDYPPRFVGGLPFRIAWLRLFDVYGPQGHRDQWVHQLILTLLREPRVPLSPSKLRRELLHVSDAADAFVKAIDDVEMYGAFNVGSGESLLTRDVAVLARDAVDTTKVLEFGARPYEHQASVDFCADVSRIARLGWRPRVALVDGLRQTVDWWRSHGGDRES